MLKRLLFASVGSQERLLFGTKKRRALSTNLRSGGGFSDSWSGAEQKTRGNSTLSSRNRSRSEVAESLVRTPLTRTQNWYLYSFRQGLRKVDTETTLKTKEMEDHLQVLDSWLAGCLYEGLTSQINVVAPLLQGSLHQLSTLPLPCMCQAQRKNIAHYGQITRPLLRGIYTIECTQFVNYSHCSFSTLVTQKRAAKKQGWVLFVHDCHQNSWHLQLP